MIKKLLIILASVLAVSAVFLFYLINTATPEGQIAGGVTVNGVNVGGMDVYEAEAALTSAYQPLLGNMTVTFKDGEADAAMCTFADFGLRYDFKSAVNQAMAAKAPMPWAKPVEISVPLNTLLKGNEDKVREIVKRVAAAKNFAAVDASFKYENGAFATIPGADGRALDVNKAVEDVLEVISALQTGVVQLAFHAVPPQHPTRDFQYEIARLGSFSTYVAQNETAGRLNNIKIAASRVNNKVILPGQIFSAGNAVGSGTPDSGYARAIVLVDGKPTEDYGGGVCQVVTTLYNAALKSELEIVERHNHSVKVSYADYAFDATVAGDYYDLKFRNNTNRPMLLVSGVAEGKLTVSVYGEETRPKNRSVQFVSKLVETTPPAPERVKYDKSVPEGEIWVTTVEQTGYKYELYKNVYINNALVETVKINTSTYKPIQGSVLQAHDY